MEAAADIVSSREQFSIGARSALHFACFPVTPADSKLARVPRLPVETPRLSLIVLANSTLPAVKMAISRR
jgi:hypothetical protein